MKVLLSAYACEPGGGSETGKGWKFADALARHGCEVTVLTCGTHHRAAIENHIRQHGLSPNLSFVWHDVPGWAGPGYEQARNIRQHYLAWQITARRRVKQMLRQQKFDVIHHLTWTVLRWPSFLGGLGPRFVFGPVGGGESAPKSVRPSFQAAAQRKERARDVLNAISRFDPMVQSCLRKADVILVTDDATKRHVASAWQDKTTVVADIFAPDIRVTDSPAPIAGSLRLLFAGRLEYWKGAQLAIGALRHLPGARLTIAGTGPDAAWMRDLAKGAAVDFIGSVPHHAMADLYASHDLFLFPSLHDSGPHVIGEALANGLPVVCLDRGGPGVAMNATCGAVVRSEGATADEIHIRLARAVMDLTADPARLAEARRMALVRASDFSYAARVADMVDRFYTPPR